MKLRTKIMISYLLLTATAFLLFYIIFVPLVRHYINENVSAGLRQEMLLIKTRTDDALREVSDRETYIKALITERIAVERLGLSSKMGFLYFNRNTGEFANGTAGIQLSDETKKKLLDRMVSIDSTPFKITMNNTDYLATYFLPRSGKQVHQRIVVIVYTPQKSISAFIRGFTRIIILVFAAVMIAAVILSLIFAGKINNPIVRLKKQAMALKARDFDARSVVKTGDEFEELSDSLNAAAEELAGYSKAQRDFLDNISHELKTPLMSIQGYAEGIRDGVFNADDQTLGIITDESIRLKKLVGEISYLSKLESMPDFYKKTNRDVKEIIEKAIDSAAGLQNARKIKIVPLNIESRTVVCDQEKILQLMINILSNSLRYAKNAVFIDTQIKNDCYMITVKDDGPGLSPGEEDNIFRRFYKGPGGNTGLGLSISLAIAQNHGGTITAWNTAPYGAVFEITLSLV